MHRRKPEIEKGQSMTLTFSCFSIKDVCGPVKLEGTHHKPGLQQLGSLGSQLGSCCRAPHIRAMFATFEFIAKYFGSCCLRHTVQEVKLHTVPPQRKHRAFNPLRAVHFHLSACFFFIFFTIFMFEIVTRCIFY